MKKYLFGAVATAAFLATPASASVTLDTETGTGFVGKGDVQTVFGWNNAVMQQRHTSISFVLDETLSYDVTCEWTTVTGGKNSKTITHTVTNRKNLSSSVAVSSQSRQTGQWTGWNLLGYAGTSGDLQVPSIGDPCPQGGSESDSDPPGNDATVVAVDNILGGGGTLSAVYNGDARVIYTF